MAIVAERLFDLSFIRSQSQNVGLSFSCGKDSLAAWVHLRQHGFVVKPFYLALIPGLEFVEHSLTFYERFFRTKIIRMIHPNLYASVDDGDFQPHSRLDAINELQVPLFGYDDVEAGFRRTAKLSPDTWIAIATKRADSPLRARRIPVDGLNPKRRVFFPLHAWRKDDVFQTLIDSRVPLPIDYELFGRSFDGWDYRFLSQIRERFPRDYQTILRWFPDAELEFLRREVAIKHGQAKKTD